MATTHVSHPGLGRRLEGHLGALVASKWFWLVLILALVGMPILRSVRTELPPPLPVLGKVPAFSLTDQYGKPFGSKDLEGKVWVANFIFTRCPTICPLFTQKMGVVQHRGRNLGEYFHLVSFTVDPEHDTPEKLLSYSKAHRVSPRMWSFLTGSREELKALIVNGLKVHMDKGDDDDLMSIAHGSHFVLVDTKGQIRGYYALEDEQTLDKLMRDAGLLATRGE